MRLTMMIVITALSGCATVASQRQQPPKLTQLSSKTFDTIRNCISSDFEREHYPLGYMVSETGGTFTYRVRGTLFWTLSLVRESDGTRVLLYGDNDKELSSRITACL